LKPFERFAEELEVVRERRVAFFLLLLLRVWEPLGQVLDEQV